MNPGNASSITVFCGLWGVASATGDWVQVDAISLQRA